MTPRRVTPVQSRRGFLSSVAAGTAGALGGLGAGCRARAISEPIVLTEGALTALLPTRRPLVLAPPDIPGDGALPDAYHHYPAKLVRVVQEKPGRGGAPIRSMAPAWGPAPPGRGRNSYIDAVNAELGVPLEPRLQDGLYFAAKLSAVLGARDVPELLAVPQWELRKVPRFSQAVKALFEDLTEHLQGDAVQAYPMLATLPTSAWRYCVWGGRLSAIPYPINNPFPWALYYRKDICDRVGIEPPKTIEELYRFGKVMTDPKRSQWAFGLVFDMVQMLFKCPGVQNGWGERPGGGLVHKYELPEYRAALEFASRLYREGMVHPEVIENNGSDAKQLFNAGKLVMAQEGFGFWRGAQSEQERITPGFQIEAVPLFSAVGGDPLVWTTEEPIFYTFVKKGLGPERTREILRVLDWCAAPFGSIEHRLSEFGVEGQHFVNGSDGGPEKTELGRKEIGGQYQYLAGRVPTLVGTPDVPHYVMDEIRYTRATYPYREHNPLMRIKVELPHQYSRVITPTDDKIRDILTGRRPLGDLAQVVDEWRRSGGDVGRKFFEKALSDSRR